MLSCYTCQRNHHPTALMEQTTRADQFLYPIALIYGGLTGMFMSTQAPARATLSLQQMTPVQKDVLLVAAMPQIYRWPERWVPPSPRQDAIAWGLVRRGVLQESARHLGAYEATAFGKQVARLLIIEDLALDQDVAMKFAA